MTTRRSRGALATLSLRFATLLAVVTLLVVAPAARAADPDAPGDTADGWRKVLAYARCALLVFFAGTPIEWSAAFADCSHTYTAEAAGPGGGL